MDSESVYSSNFSVINKTGKLFPRYFSSYVLYSAIRGSKEFLSPLWNITTLTITFQTRIQSLASQEFQQSIPMPSTQRFLLYSLEPFPLLNCCVLKKNLKIQTLPRANTETIKPLFHPGIVGQRFKSMERLVGVVSPRPVQHAASKAA